MRKGEVAIMVGREGEERRRVVVPVDYLNHPLFTSLLKVAEEEYEFRHDGAVTIPCGFAEFSYVKGLIDNMRDGDDPNHRRSHPHNHLRIGCFGRA